MRSKWARLAVAWLALHAGNATAGAIRLPDGRRLENVDFERHVQALLDRQGCNAGKCHGNRAGAGGFALSLFAASPESDFLEITRRGNGRHISVTDPERSLLLLKATGQQQHAGGVRITIGSWEHRLLRTWIAEGARRASGRGQIKSLKVIPNDHIFHVGDNVQPKVIAEFADGATEDVTCFCSFRLPKAEEKEAAPVRLSPGGALVAIKPGEVCLSVVYRGQVRMMRARVVVPVAKHFVYPPIAEVNFIDHEVFGQLRKLHIVPSDLCSDEQFLRRVMIDLIGTLPAPAEVQAFLASKDPDKRARKIDELLAHPLHAALLALRFCEMTDLVGDTADAKAPRNKATQLAHGWFRKRLQENMPYDQIVAGVLTATSREGRRAEDWLKEKAALHKADTGFGGAYARRATLDIFWRDGGLVRPSDPVFGSWAGTHRRPTGHVDAIYLEGIAERAASAFLGMTLECARCHVHPLDGWTPTDHRAFANVFGQVRLEEIPFKTGTLSKWEQAAFAREVFLGDVPLHLKGPDLDGRTFLAAVSQGDEPGASLSPLAPRLLGGPEVDLRTEGRLALMHWLVQPQNPFFARRFVNLIWQHYFGVGLADATDSFTAAHRSGQHPLLDQLAREFIATNFDIRRLERTILLSRTYQLSSVPNETNKHDRTNFARTVPRRHDARILTEIVHVLLETSEDYGPGVPAGLHANEIAHVARAFSLKGYDDGYSKKIARLVHQFGRGDLVSRCNDEADLRSHLAVYGSSEIQGLLASSKRIARLAASDQLDFDAVLDEAFLAALGRLPSDSLRKEAAQHLRRDWSKNRRRVLEDLFWALINYGEFSTRL